MHERRRVLGGYLPSRKPAPSQTKAPGPELVDEFRQGSKEPHPSSTMAFVKLLTRLMKSDIGKRIVPIIPDEARTFGMEAMFRNYGIYASGGQLYKPHDADILLYYKEAKDGQILEEGITEAGSMAEFTAAGTAYSNYGVDMHSVLHLLFDVRLPARRRPDLGFRRFSRQRLPDGRNGRAHHAFGEGLQHQDGHSLLLASTVPTIAAYDPCYAYEIAVIVREGIRRMYENREDLFYYITLYNETYPQAPMPDGSEEGILKGLYLFNKSSLAKPKGRVQLLGSGPILTEALKAQQILAEQYNVAADVWSATSYSELRREALRTERWNRLHPAEPARKPLVQTLLEPTEGPIVAASDYMKIVQDQIAQWLSGRYHSLGTDGFGRSDNRAHLSAHFEVNAASIAGAALSKSGARRKVRPQKSRESSDRPRPRSGKNRRRHCLTMWGQPFRGCRRAYARRPHRSGVRSFAIRTSS